MNREGKVYAIKGNMVTASCTQKLYQNEIAYIVLGEQRLKSEVIKVDRNFAIMQVFEETHGVGPGDKVEFTGNLLSISVGPGLLGTVYDGLQNPLEVLASKSGDFLERGMEVPALDLDKKWLFKPLAKVGDRLRAGSFLGEVQEGNFSHKIMVPFSLRYSYLLTEIVDEGEYNLRQNIAQIKNSSTQKITSLQMTFESPVKVAVKCYKRRLLPETPMLTGTRVIDTFYPVARGGTYCIPGPFGAGKTVVQQITSRYAKADIVIIVACGERAGEVVETMREFPKLEDPSTGKSLMERTIIICNTSSMPVAAREASVYTGIALAEYYRQMGLNVLLLADSTSRWAQAMREMSGRLEEIPGEEAFPAYLESRIASFYERAGLVELNNGERGSITIGGTVSPAGGNFSEPVTQASLKVVGAFHGLSRERAQARKFPSIHPLDSWTKYESIQDKEKLDLTLDLLKTGAGISQMMNVLGEDGLSIEDYIIYQKSELIDAVFIQQNSFDKVDAFCSEERQIYLFEFIFSNIVKKSFNFNSTEEVRSFFQSLRQKFIDWNYKEWQSAEFNHVQEEILHSLLGVPA